MDSTSRYDRNRDIVFREEDDGAFLFNPDSGNLKYLNLTGKETYAMLDGKKDIGQLTTELQEQYPDVESQQIRKDLEEFLEALKMNNFIQPVDSK
jgi:hypothetical protein